jgi:hypothetical protein
VHPRIAKSPPSTPLHQQTRIILTGTQGDLKNHQVFRHVLPLCRTCCTEGGHHPFPFLDSRFRDRSQQVWQAVNHLQ